MPKPFPLNSSLLLLLPGRFRRKAMTHGRAAVKAAVSKKNSTSP